MHHRSIRLHTLAWAGAAALAAPAAFAQDAAAPAASPIPRKATWSAWIRCS